MIGLLCAFLYKETQGCARESPAMPGLSRVKRTAQRGAKHNMQV